MLYSALYFIFMYWFTHLFRKHAFFFFFALNMFLRHSQWFESWYQELWSRCSIWRVLWFLLRLCLWSWRGKEQQQQTQYSSEWEVWLCRFLWWWVYTLVSVKSWCHWHRCLWSCINYVRQKIMLTSAGWTITWDGLTHFSQNNMSKLLCSQQLFWLHLFPASILRWCVCLTTGSKVVPLHCEEEAPFVYCHLHK